MFDNTIVMASDTRYVWGCWLLIASMRKHSMNEPVIVLGYGYSDSDIACLKAFAGVTVESRQCDSKRNMTCSKPDAMLLADTEYVTWVDCDGMFTGNCSEYLTADPEHLHVRLRGIKENSMVFAGRYSNSGKDTNIPVAILNIWRKDVEENSEPAIDTSVSACYISAHRNHRPFLEKWRNQMHKVLPNDDVGVVDNRSMAYFQTDESVLNSVLCFSSCAPPPTENYMLDKDVNAYFVHFAYPPKPWQMWNSYTVKHLDKTLDVVDWALAQGFPPPGKVPFSLESKYRGISYRLAPLGKHVHRIKKLLRKFC